MHSSQWGFTAVSAETWSNWSPDTLKVVCREFQSTATEKWKEFWPKAFSFAFFHIRNVDNITLHARLFATGGIGSRDKYEQVRVNGETRAFSQPRCFGKLYYSKYGFRLNKSVYTKLQLVQYSIIIGIFILKRITYLQEWVVFTAYMWILNSSKMQLLF